MFVVWKGQFMPVVIPGFPTDTACLTAERETEEIATVQAWKCYEVLRQ